MKILCSAFLSFLSISSVSAFSSGAGRCVVGGPSPFSTHLSQSSITTGTLSDGDYTATINGVLVEEGDTVSVPLGELFDIEISGPQFKGVLIMVSGEDSSAIFPGPELKLADANPPEDSCVGTASVTHSGAGFKTSAVASVFLDLPTTTTIELNVVVKNSDQESIYYYNSVNLETVEITDPPTEAPIAPETPAPTAAPSAAPIAAQNGVAAPTAPPSAAATDPIIENPDLVSGLPTDPPIPVPPAPAAGDCSYLGNTVQAGQWLRGPTHTCLCDSAGSGMWLYCTRNMECPWGSKWVSGYCVKDWCQVDYMCPPNSSRKNYRDCYDSFADCECDCGYHKSWDQCVKNAW